MILLLGLLSLPTLAPAAGKPHIKVGHVVAVDAALGAILLQPGNYSGQIAGQVDMASGVATATVAVGAAFNGRPVIAQMNEVDGTLFIKSAAIAAGSLVITMSGNTTDIRTISYAIIG